MIRHVCSILVVAGAFGLWACSSTGDSGDAAAPRGDDRSALQVINRATGGTPEETYGHGADRYDAKPQYNYANRYYETHFSVRDAAGNAVPLVDQAQFLDVSQGNVTPGSVTTAGSRSVPSSAPTDQRQDAEFIDSTGARRKLSEWRGRPTVVIFTRGFPGYICPLCTAYTAQFAVRYAEIKAMGAEVLLVFPVEAGDEGVVEQFKAACDEVIASEGLDALPYPVLLDLDMEATSKFGLQADLSRPATYIFDSQGVLAWGFEGREPHQRPKVERVLENLSSISRN